VDWGGVAVMGLVMVLMLIFALGWTALGLPLSLPGLPGLPGLHL
jgi:hypothetical protein